MIKCGVSARHVHLCQRDIDILFGKGYEFKKLKDTYNPGWVTTSKLGSFLPLDFCESRVLMPATLVSQIEVSKSDCVRYGIEAPLRRSLDIKDAPKVSVYSKTGKTEVSVIRTKRHLHLTPKEAEILFLKDGDYCAVEAGTVLFKEVLVRVGDYKASFHIDTDEGNAARVKDGDEAVVVR